MSFKNKPGCPMCSIVASARTTLSTDESHQKQAPGTPEHPSSPSRAPFLHQSQNTGSTPSPSPTANAFSANPSPVTRTNSADKRKAKEEAPEVVWHDANFTAYRERKYAVSDIAHFVIVFNLHVPSIYMLSSSDVPLLVALRTLATRLLSETTSSDSTSTSPSSTKHCIGFVTPPWRDPSIPVSDHVHAHAYIGPPTRAGWYRRALAYSPLAWYAIDDLIAEIREESSNNRIRSPASAGDGTSNAVRPIDRIPGAGAREGTASGQETTREAFAKGNPTLDIGPDEDIETGRSPAKPSAGHPALLPATETRIPAPVGDGGSKNRSKRTSLVRMTPPPDRPDSPQEAA